MPIMRTLLLLPLTLALAVPLAGQTMRGRVLDAATGEGVAQAQVQALTEEGRDGGHTRTRADGSFEIPLRAPGTFRIRAERTGYNPTVTTTLPVALREAVEVEVRLSASAVAIEPLRVTARVQPPHRRNLEMNGYYDRERQGIGRYLRREDIERYPTQNLAQLLSRVPGTAIQYVRTKQYIYFMRNGGCRPQGYLDNVRMVVDATMDINAIVTPGQIEAVEMYRGAAEIPVQYNNARGAVCGVVLIWTRSEP